VTAGRRRPNAVLAVGERVDFSAVPAEVEEILRDYAAAGDSGQVILNLNKGAVESYKTVRYVRVIDKRGARKGE
jgi:hypothetical protein